MTTFKYLIISPIKSKYEDNPQHGKMATFTFIPSHVHVPHVYA